MRASVNHRCTLVFHRCNGVALLSKLLMAAVLLTAPGIAYAQQPSPANSPQVVLLDSMGNVYAYLVGTRNIKLPTGALPNGVDTIRLPSQFHISGDRTSVSHCGSNASQQARKRITPKGTKTPSNRIERARDTACRADRDSTAFSIREAMRMHQEAIRAHQAALQELSKSSQLPHRAVNTSRKQAHRMEIIFAPDEEVVVTFGC